jgi:small subunit ribosomal protein S4e
MTHLKRQEVPKSWPIRRKGTAYVVRPSSDLGKGIPILVVLRDILKVAQNRKEVKMAIYEKQIMLNDRLVTNEKIAMVLFDIITIIPLKKSYRLEVGEKGKFELKEIKHGENKKVAKLTDKKILRGKKTQLNLSDGTNFLSEIKCKVNDSLIVNLKDRKVEKCLPFEEKANAIVFEGKHAGEKGIIEKIDNTKKIAEVKIDGNKVNILIKQMMVVE